MATSKNKEEQIKTLSKLLKRKRSFMFYANKMGISEREVRALIPQARARQEGRVLVEESIRKEDLEKGTLESVIELDFEPKDHRQLAKLHKIDLSKFIITNYWSKLKSNGNFTSSVFSKRKTPQDYSIEDFTKFLQNYKTPHVPTITIPKDKNKTTVDIEVSIADYHLAKKYVDEITSLDKRVKAFYGITGRLVGQASAVYNINKIVFPISNDFFHTDNYWNSSTKGTPQDVIAEYDEEYEAGFDVLVKSIQLMKLVAEEVVVILVPGNHDKTKGFFLAHALEVYFRSEKNISFLRESTPTKYVTLGNTFIGYHHGNCKIDELPLLFATGAKSSSEFGDAVFREVHTGDKHHYMAKEVKGVRIQQMPSLSGNDRWHRENNYVNNVRAALVLIYHPEKGKCGEFEERL